MINDSQEQRFHGGSRSSNKLLLPASVGSRQIKASTDGVLRSKESLKVVTAEILNQKRSVQSDSAFGSNYTMGGCLIPSVEQKSRTFESLQKKSQNFLKSKKSVESSSNTIVSNSSNPSLRATRNDPRVNKSTRSDAKSRSAQTDPDLKRLQDAKNKTPRDGLVGGVVEKTKKQKTTW